MIQKLLVANRGEIAARVMRTAHAMGLGTVAVYSDPDADAPFVGLADEAVRLAGAAPSDTYLNAEAIIDAARLTGADAVHPGYGFLSENAGFAAACAEAGLTFVGPPPAVIAAMGSKVEAKALMEKAGVPVLPGATLDEDSDLAAEGQRVGYPLLVKAAFGGGGRGMRIVESADALADAVAAARREAASAFGDATVFLERYVVNPRHVEVQILADTHGAVVHLFERDCSIQRRHQKIVEESPSPAVDDTLRAELGAAAVAAAKAIGYVGAGTVEFVLWAGGFAFLEVNTRLQVEHPVTELITGLDLVELQLRIADGEPLPPEAFDARIRGHAIEARLYAEDVCAGFLPATGVLHRFAVPDDPGVRVDTGVADGSVVSPHYDPMLAKVIAHGPTRADAARRLARTLARAQLHGVTTNRDLLVGILREEEFLAGSTDTGYLTRHDPSVLAARVPGALAVHAAAAALAAQVLDRLSSPVLRTLPAAWRNIVRTSQRASYRCGERAIGVAHRQVGDRVLIEVDGEPLSGVRVQAAAPQRVVLEIDGVRRSISVHRACGVSYVDSALGSTVLVEVPRFPDPSSARHAGSLVAPMPGTVVRVLATPGADVATGQGLIVLEAMKMEHTVTAPADGTVVDVCVAAGDQVDAGQTLAIVEDSSAASDGGQQ
ncbi:MULTISPECIES: biotin carboxylase N-terminal domain-containing protein [Mycobacteriaceae]|jgi:propionyl-CoA carboxylase alpha chain|uniref:ATP-binding protein n=1 Tax=Mycobacteriaceae TaxID=1762 RepID=UPI000BAF7A57|nr:MULTISPECIES: biotin carboxylase N-terminal domain-containing protein [Mycobacterium]MDZ4266415.1 biotin carboxylase N-terminal domain-containing protein [Mycobacterium sp.]MEE3066440.1 biotin carboxylase N-terminal domain-containing protein [Actinomycetota bacterium]PBA14041.1 acetyl/propionyl-CoA carboxylase subunit alpha [Mycobacterium avium]TMS50786.1 ATP-grasp domain-containing protein [Mycobacterium sp. DBP42]GAY17575.1 acetyl/propionyl-CoA carboxylase subuit alpha [Mycobacterium sp. 